MRLIHSGIVAAVVVAVGCAWTGSATGQTETKPKVTTVKKNEEYADFNYGEAGGKKEWVESWVEVISVSKPELRSDVKGNVAVEFKAPTMTTAKAMCWQQPTQDKGEKWGHDVTVADIKLDDEGKGTFTFNADEFPNGPMNVRLYTHNAAGKRDYFEVQLYNTGGVKWNQGFPKEDPPAAKGMKLAFSDDFDGPLSISKDGKGAKYNAHKPTYGDFSGWQFADPVADGKPFSQVGTYLKIAARKDAESPKGRSGLIAPVAMDGSGYWAKPPFYMECRFTAQSATGTWPAFWTITSTQRGVPGDELDIVEAYGGLGKRNPNHPGYSITSHFWNQVDEKGAKKKSVNTRVPIMELGGKSYWSTTFHTYGLLVNEKETVYYFDDIEVLRHPTNDKSLNPHCLLINYAIGGISGWRIDLERYGNGSDMYVDWVRVYEGEKK